MMKLVAICLLAISTSSCISFYDTQLRDIDICIYAMVDPAIGSVKEAIDANEENWEVNAPHCARQFEQLE